MFKHLTGVLNKKVKCSFSNSNCHQNKHAVLSQNSFSRKDVYIPSCFPLALEVGRAFMFRVQGMRVSGRSSFRHVTQSAFWEE